MCPVINEMTDWERREALAGDSYGYNGDFDSRPRSYDYGDPRDYREWCDWKRTMHIMTPSRQVSRKKLSLPGVLWGWSCMLPWWLRSCD